MTRKSDSYGKRMLVDLLKRGDGASATDIVIRPGADGIEVYFGAFRDYTHDRTLDWEEYAVLSVQLAPFLLGTQVVLDDGENAVMSRFGGPLRARAMVRPSPSGDVFALLEIITIRLIGSKPLAPGEMKHEAAGEAKVSLDGLLAEYDHVVAALGVGRVPWDTVAVRSSLVDAADDGVVDVAVFAKLIDRGVLYAILDHDLSGD